jgi:hypothetical protein
MPQLFQKAGIAMLLASPSTLNKAWRGGDQTAFNNELTRLGFSTAAIDVAKQSAQKLNTDVQSFIVTADRMRTDLWAGGEPHPPDNDAVRIVAALRAMDGE